MLGIRRSLSIRRKRDGNSRISSETAHSPDTGGPADRSSQNRSSIDSLVIPQRTRYPSAKQHTPESIDLCVARALLEHQPQRQLETHSATSNDQKQWNTSNTCERGEATGISDGSDEAQSDDKLASRSVSVHPMSRIIRGSQRSPCRDTTIYVALYNRLARDHGLKELGAMHESNIEQFYERFPQVDEPSTPTISKQSSKNWLLNKLARTPSSVNLKSVEPRLSKKESIRNLLTYGRKPSSRCKSLDDICRLGGISVLRLPGKYAAVNLTVPTCLAATANFLAQQGSGTPGIFRIPGQNSTVNALYQHYVLRVGKSQEVGEVETTIGSLNLPDDIPFNTHDVASAFKKFIWDFPGGILGSVKLFEALRDICMLQLDDSSPAVSFKKPKLITLALLSLRSRLRLALISAVFGLLAFLKQDQDDNDPPRQTGPESMSSKALAVVFAPILLGDLAEQVELDPLTDEQSECKDNRTIRRNLFGNSKTSIQIRSKLGNKDIASSVEKTKACAALAEYLIQSWEEIVGQFRMFEAVSTIQPLSLQRVSSSEEQDQLIAAAAAPAVLKVAPGGSKGSTLLKVVSNPLLVGPERLTKPLPELPIAEIQMDTGICRSASMSVMPSGRSGRGRVQIRSPSGRRHFARSTTALHCPEAGDQPSSATCHDNIPISTDSQQRRVWWEISTVSNSGGSNEEDNLSCQVSNQDRESLHRGDHPKIGDSNSDNTLSSSNLDCAHVEHQTSKQETEDDVVLSNLVPVTENGVKSSMEAVEEKHLSPNITESVMDPKNIDIKYLTPDPHDSGAGEIFAPGAPSAGMAIGRVNGRPGYQKEASTEPHTPLTTLKEHRAITKSLSSMIPRPANDFAKAQRAAVSPVVGAGGSSGGAVVTGSQSSPCRGKVWRYGDGQASDETDEQEAARVEAVGRRRVAQTQWGGRKNNAFRFYGAEEMQQTRESEPPVARRLTFRSPSEERRRPRVSPEGQVSAHPVTVLSGGWKPNVGTLYAEIRRLHGQLGSKREDVRQLRQQVEAMKQSKDSGTLSEKLRETEREMRMWKQRAQWAEAELQEHRKNWKQVRNKESDGGWSESFA